MRSIFFIGILSIILIGCGGPSPREAVRSSIAESGSETEIFDPLESWNRSMMTCNRFLDHTLFYPFLCLYQNMPKKVKTGVFNFLSTVDEPISMINCLLQFDLDAFLFHTARFLLNGVFGFGGLVDTARELRLTPEPQDLGKTLQKMAGMPPGFFLVLPIFGPTTLRDGLGHTLDLTIHPIKLWRGSGWAYHPLSWFNTKLNYKDGEEQAYKNFEDPYVIIRGAYYESRGDLKNGLEGEEDVMSAAQEVEREEREHQQKIKTKKKG